MVSSVVPPQEWATYESPAWAGLSDGAQNPRRSAVRLPPEMERSRNFDQFANIG